MPAGSTEQVGLKVFSRAVRRRPRLRLTLLLAVAVFAGPALTSASAASEQAVRLWHQSIRGLQLPSRGCFNASYPAVTWRKVRCAPKPPAYLHETPPDGSPAQASFDSLPGVGNEGEVGGEGGGGTYSAEVPTGNIATAVGTIPSLTSGATEEDGGTAELFSLQMNANTFSGPPECGKIAGCEGWEQFIYSSNPNEVLIEFWLRHHQKPKEGNKCPSGWTWTGPQTEKKYEYLEEECDLKSEATALSGGALTVSGLTGTTFEGRANSGGNDEVVMVTGGGKAVASSAASTLDLDKGWKIAEFAVLGDWNGTKANFSANTTMTVNTAIKSASDAPPICRNTSFTAESNNLTAEGTPALSKQPFPTISSQATNGTATTASCATYGVGAPKVTLTTPSEGAPYLYGQSVDANYSCEEAAGATLESCVGTVEDGKPISTTTGPSNTFTVTAKDTDGQTTIVKHAYTVTAPPKAKIEAPGSGGTYEQGSVVPSKFSCEEGTFGPGLESCDDNNGTDTVSGGSGTLETSSLGPHTYKVTAKSKDGRTESASITYTVSEPPAAKIEAPLGGGFYKVGEVVPTAFTCKEGAFGPGLESCDDSNGVDTAAGGAGALETAALGLHKYTVTAKSKDGQTGGASIGYTVAEPPSAKIESPAGGGTYRAGEVIPTVFNCTEGAFGPGLESCDDNNGTDTVAGGLGTLGISTVGIHTYTVTALSKDGQSGSASITETAINACGGVLGFADGNGKPIAVIDDELSVEAGARQYLKVSEKLATVLLVEGPLGHAECVVASDGGLEFIGSGPARYGGKAGYETVFALDITSKSTGHIEVQVNKEGATVYTAATPLGKGIEATPPI